MNGSGRSGLANAVGAPGTANDRHHGLMLTALAPARRRLVLIVAAIVAVAAVAAGAITVAKAIGGGSSSTSGSVSAEVLGPVLLVPGYGGSVTGLNSLATRLRADGRSVTVFNPPGNATGDLDGQARALATTAAALVGSAGASSIDVVGYSAGGVVARIWVRDYGGAKIARRIVTMGSPQHGTQLAGLAGSLVPSDCPLACQQLEPGSDVLNALNAGAEVPKGSSFVSIWTTGDNVVIPPESAELAGALNIKVQAICPNEKVDHSELPTDPVVEGMVAAELAPGAPVGLGPADCARLSTT
jgi:triacylglycerol lipase